MDVTSLEGEMRHLPDLVLPFFLGHSNHFLCSNIHCVCRGSSCVCVCVCVCVPARARVCVLLLLLLVVVVVVVVCVC